MSTLALLRRWRGLLVDMDGVIYRGEEALPGAVRFFPLLNELGVAFVLLTNNSARMAAQYAAKLARLGIEVAPEHILTSGEAAALYLGGEAPGARVYVIGEDGLKEPLRARGFILTARRPDFVVVGFDRRFTYRKLRLASAALRAGAGFIAANPDATLPTEAGLLPGTGPLLAAIQACTGHSPLVIGKPGPYMLRLALARLGLPAEAAAIVGDRLDTDIAAGAAIGLGTVLLLSGIARQEDVAAAPVKPHLIFADLAELGLVLRQAREGTAS